MNTVSELFFKVGNVENYKYHFVGKHKERLVEFIHCIVLERLEEYDGFSPRKVRVNQIHNLEAFLADPEYDGFTERTLKTDNLEQIFIRE